MIGHALVAMATTDLERNAWLVGRSHGVGGSDLPKIAGISKYGNALSVYLDKLDPLRHTSQQMSESAEIGLAVEEVVAQLWMRRHPELCLKTVPAILRHPEHAWALADIDRVVVDRATGQQVGVWEGKSAGTKAGWEDDGIPEDYQVQGQWYLGITGLPRVWFAALTGGFGGMTIEEREATADPELFGHLLKIAADFWALVETRQPPAIDGSDASTELLKRLHPRALLPPIELPPQGELLAAAFREAQARVDEAESERDRLANELKLLLGDAEAGVCPGYRVQWANVTVQRLDTAALKEAHPALVAGYTAPSSYRRFSVKPIKQEEGKR